MLVLHGILRNADVYFKSALAARAAAGPEAVSSLMIAPQFLTDYDAKAHGLGADILVWHRLPLTMQAQVLIFFAFFFAFAVKVPMWPVHTWLPDAHVEAPTAGSVILAGVLLKMGGYGFVRFSLPMFPLATAYFTPLIFTLSIIAIIYTSLVALAQEDMKKLIAYSSVAHMGIVTLGIFTVTEEGLQGAVIQMLSHGVVSAALFLIVGVVYDRLHTREIARYGGLADVMPRYAEYPKVPFYTPPTVAGAIHAPRQAVGYGPSSFSPQTGAIYQDALNVCRCK